MCLRIRKIPQLIIAAMLLFALCGMGLGTASADAEVGTMPSVTSIEVLAIEYPPFTSTQLADFGLSFRLLHTSLISTSFKIQPRFLPSARAQKQVDSGQWLASFYPPTAPVPAAYQKVPLAEGLLQIGLFRRMPESPASAFRWSTLGELAGWKVAIGRRSHEGPLSQALTQASVEVVPVDGLNQAFQLLDRGRVDAVFAEKLSGFFVIQSLGLLGHQFQFSETVFEEIPVAVWVNGVHPDGRRLIEALEAVHP